MSDLFAHAQKFVSVCFTRAAFPRLLHFFLMLRSNSFAYADLYHQEEAISHYTKRIVRVLCELSICTLACIMLYDVVYWWIHHVYQDSYPQDSHNSLASRSQLLQYPLERVIQSAWAYGWITFNLAMWGFHEYLSETSWRQCRRVSMGVLLASSCLFWLSFFSTALQDIDLESGLTISIPSIFVWFTCNVVLEAIEHRLNGAKWKNAFLLQLYLSMGVTEMLGVYIIAVYQGSKEFCHRLARRRRAYIRNEVEQGPFVLV